MIERTGVTEKPHTSTKLYTKSCSSVKNVKLNSSIQLQDITTESESIADASEAAKPLLDKPFGCGLCGEMFETEEVFLEHCFSHRLSPAANLFLDLC